MKTTYFFSFMLTKLKVANTWVLFNWLNTNNVFIEDCKHPLYKILNGKQKEFSDFLVDDSADDFNYLLENYFIVKDQEIIRNIVREKYNELISGKKMNLILMPANQSCNFRCRYCYEDHSKNTLMDDYDIETIKSLVVKNSPESLNINYFGGEPLLNIDFIKKCNQAMVDFSRKYEFAFNDSSMTTNGYLLTKDVFLELYDLRVTSYQITIDGERENHDNLRPLSNGFGTYDVIYKNLLDIASTDKIFNITLRTNFTPLSGSPKVRQNFLTQIHNDFKGDKRFVLSPEAVGNWSDDKKDDLDMYCSKGSALKFRSDFQREAEVLGLETVGMRILCEPGDHFCYAGRPNNIIIYPHNADGNLPIQKCTLEVNNAINNVGHINIDGEIIKNINWYKWADDKLFKTKKCQNCFLVLSCFSNTCANANINNKFNCPKEKQQENSLVLRLLDYIQKNSK